jgi:hypothetical protein
MESSVEGVTVPQKELHSLLGDAMQCHLSKPSQDKSIAEDKATPKHKCIAFS